MVEKTYQHIAVLMGGPSAEREVSLNSGRAVAEALRSRGYRVDEVDVRDTTLQIPTGVEAVFIALHGTFGEDGQVQDLLRERNLPYTGSDAASSRLAFDKLATKRLFEREGLSTAPYEVISANEQRTLPLPVVVKPVRQGSSIGIHRVFDERDWPAALADAAAYDEQVLVEKFIKGRELTVGVVGEEQLPVLEIKAPEGYYDYRAKYTKGVTEYLVPAPVSETCARQCRDLAGRAFRALGCRALARVDFRMNSDGDLFILEVNTIPGFTATSLLPKAARARGIEFPDLCERIMQMARVQ